MFVLWNQSLRRIENSTSLYPTREDAEAAIERLRASRVQRTTWSDELGRDVENEELLVAVEVPT